MAFSNTPIVSTYSTHRLPLVRDLRTLPSSLTIGEFYEGMQNVLPFKAGNSDQNGDFFGQTRAAMIGNTVLSGGSYTCRGMHVWEKTAGTIYFFVALSNGTSSLVYSSTDGITFSLVNTLTNNATTPIRFVEFIDGTNTKKLVMVDGIEGYVFTSNVAGTKIVSANFPTPHAPFPIFIDGYLFLAKSGTGDIYNSNLNDPTTWTSGSFISSELYPDDIQALVKVNNYLLAIGTEGCEYFYDAAVATASPLARYEGGSLPFGTRFPNSVACNKDTVMLLANTGEGESSFKLIEGFKHQDIPAEVILRGFGNAVSSGSIPNNNSTRACFIKQAGHLFYIFNFNGVGTNNLSDTVAYSLNTKHWVYMRHNDLAYSVLFSAPATTTRLYTYFAGQGSFSEGVMFGYLDPSQVADNISSIVSPIEQLLYIGPETFGTLNLKTMSRCGIYYEPTRGFSTAINLQWYDTPGAFVNSANFPTGGISSGADGFPFITQLGMFRYRWFSVILSGGLVAWYYLECDINKGQQ